MISYRQLELEIYNSTQLYIVFVLFFVFFFFEGGFYLLLVVVLERGWFYILQCLL